MTRQVLICVAICSLLLFNCSKKSITNNYYPSGDRGSIVGFVYPPDSEAKVTAYLGMEIAWTHIDIFGYFELTELPPGTYILLVEADGYIDHHSDKTIWVPGGVTVSVDSVFLASVHDLILSVSPSDGAEEVSVSEDIEISFRRDMNAALVESAFHVEPEVEGEFFWHDDDRPPEFASGSTDLRFVPRDQFATNTRYQVEIDTVASDAEGTRLAEPYEFSFTTEPVRISYTYPQNKQTWVDTSTDVYIRFNTDMNAESVVLAFKMADSELKEVTGWFRWNNQSYMTFHPDSDLTADEIYTVTIDTNAKDISGGSLDKPYNLWFKTHPGSFGGARRAMNFFPLMTR